MAQKHPRQFRLLITISVLFTTLIIIFGLLFREFIYRQTSEMLMEESQRYFSHVNDQLMLDFLSTRKSIHQSVRILSKSGIGSGKLLEERLGYIPLIQAALEEEPNLSGLQVGYDTGDYFIVRSLRSDYLREFFTAPPRAEIVVDNITAGVDNRRYLQRLWYAKSGVELGRAKPKATDYDPRTRLWFKTALMSDEPVSTEPYLFRFMKQMGLTIAYRPQGVQAVIAGDITLHHLSETLARYQQTPRSEMVLFEKKDDGYWLTAYEKPNLLMTQQRGGYSRSRAGSAGIAVIDFVASLPDVLHSFFTFTYEDETWFGSTQRLNLPGRDNFFLVALAPENELLLEAKRLQRQTLLYTLGMTLLCIPVTWFLAKKISNPMQSLAQNTERISRFEFSDQEPKSSFIKEVDELSRAMKMMESTIGKFIALITSLASEQNFDTLLSLINEEIMTISDADAAFTYLVSKTSNRLKPGAVRSKVTGELKTDILPTYDLGGDSELAGILSKGVRVVKPLDAILSDTKLIKETGLGSAKVIVVPAKNRQKEVIGILCLVFNDGRQIESEEQKGRLAFIEALSGFAAVSLESREMLRKQKDLLESFIKLIAGAIDSKSPYTGGHCQRVPVLTKLLARKACESKDPDFADFTLSNEQWEAIHIASWLHDCGKVTTPEFVVDKATKLETMYDRIHEIRMRFEILKREAHISYWQHIAAGGNMDQLLKKLEAKWKQIDEDFAFVAECNLGGNFMDPSRLERLQEIAKQSWKRTIDDRLGISWEEKERKEREPAKPLPAAEQLLADKNEHLFTRSKEHQLPPDNEYGFDLDIPDYLYNKGELHNLMVSRGTLTEEERYRINDHIVQTIIMLKKLPYPKHLSEVPDIAGGHHEKIDGTGYPRKLSGEQMSIPAKMVVIADIFEALTASDRPYKKAKTLSEAIKIMGFMEKDQHIDPQLFRLFLSSGAYLEYAHEFLNLEQIDDFDINHYLGG